ncbi:hypothetical protein RF11_08507 [Thelohanellus kitauei]|uniref:Uncharacterized protein n=1 Tax=Thelohanellus kitauei TaxID=669202 RepID=A0A0C2MXA8_THEKT|nr:hypothetical protein RF11_08507 [Thelohanellus kitauei]
MSTFPLGWLPKGFCWFLAGGVCAIHDIDSVVLGREHIILPLQLKPGWWIFEHVGEYDQLSGNTKTTKIRTRDRSQRKLFLSLDFGIFSRLNSDTVIRHEHWFNPLGCMGVNPLRMWGWLDTEMCLIQIFVFVCEEEENNTSEAAFKDNLTRIDEPREVKIE